VRSRKVVFREEERIRLFRAGCVTFRERWMLGTFSNGSLALKASRYGANNMSSDSPLPGSLAIELLTQLATSREQLKVAAEQLRESRDDKDASGIAQETIDFLTQWIKSFQGHCWPPSLE